MDSVHPDVDANLASILDETRGLLIYQEQAVEVFPASGIPQRLELLEVLEATPEFPGLQLQLAEIWAG